MKDLYKHHSVFQQIPHVGRNDRDYFACTFIYTLLEIFFAPLREYLLSVRLDKMFAQTPCHPEHSEGSV